MASDTEHFKVSEFVCKCGCGFGRKEGDLDQRLIDMAETIRQAVGVPVRVNSGCRCAKHNRAVGGVKGSKHMLGKAADLSCSLGAAKLFQTVKKLYAEGKLPALDFCKEYKSWIHIDCGGKRNHIWEPKS
ncbi:MAG: hypothetical protein II964_00690 [Synergistaceae bacterium]|nr:hypothetical protein [Synergistaceae bacterium]